MALIKIYVHVALAALALVAARPVDCQGNSYLGLWGKVFEGVAPNESPPQPSTLTLHERLQNAAAEWRSEAEGAQSRLMQRFKGLNRTHYEPSWNATEALADLAALLPGGKTDAAAEAATSALLLPELSLLPNSTLTSLVDDLKQRIGSAEYSGKIDPSQLAALAVLQGWALKTLANRHSSTSGTGSNAALGAATQGGLLPTSRLAIPGRWKSAPNASLAIFSEVGVILPDSMVDNFQPEVCARLQDFGNAPGYIGAWLGGAPCGSSNAQGSKSAMSWGQQATFQLDCSMHQPIGLQHTLECTLGVASHGQSSPGSGAVLHHSRVTHVLTGPHMNAVRIRICNTKPTMVGQVSTKSLNDATELRVHSLKLNGRHLKGGESLTVAQGVRPEACSAITLRVPSRALGEGFVLTGALDATGSGAWGVGEMASVDLQVGEVHLLGAKAEGDVDDGGEWVSS